MRALETRNYGPGKTLPDLTRELVEIQNDLMMLAQSDLGDAGEFLYFGGRKHTAPTY